VMMIMIMIMMDIHDMTNDVMYDIKMSCDAWYAMTYELMHDMMIWSYMI
jgi:hypothetical protein